MTNEKKTREHVGRVVRKEIAIQATPEQVWDAWAKADRIARWFVDSCEGDMRPGEAVTWCFETFGYRFPVQVFEAQRPHYLAFGGEMPGRPPALQEIEIEQRGGTTILRLANSGFGEGAQWDEEYEGVDSGWVLALATLKHWLENHADESRVHRIAMRPAPIEYETLQPLYTTGEGLRSWLADEARLGRDPLEPGAELHLALSGDGDGVPLDGRVLARTNREILFTWQEERAVLGLKSFSMGPAGRAVALDFNAWGSTPERAERAAKLCEGALDRLLAALPVNAKGGG